MPDIGPTVDGATIGYWIAQYKALNSVAACPIGPSCQDSRGEQSAAVSQETPVTDIGPICEAYDPEIAAIFAVDLG